MTQNLLLISEILQDIGLYLLQTKSTPEDPYNDGLTVTLQPEKYFP